MVAFHEASWKFPRQDHVHDFKELRGFPGIELGFFRVAKSSGEGREVVWCMLCGFISGKLAEVHSNSDGSAERNLTDTQKNIEMQLLLKYAQKAASGHTS